MTEDASTLPRETGSEVKTSPCPNCGTELTWIPTAIGGHQAENCPTCWPPAVVDAPQTADADATPPVTTGTQVADPADPPADPSSPDAPAADGTGA